MNKFWDFVEEWVPPVVYWPVTVSCAASYIVFVLVFYPLLPRRLRRWTGWFPA